MENLMKNILYVIHLHNPHVTKVLVELTLNLYNRLLTINTPDWSHRRRRSCTCREGVRWMSDSRRWLCTAAAKLARPAAAPVCKPARRGQGHNPCPSPLCHTSRPRLKHISESLGLFCGTICWRMLYYSLQNPFSPIPVALIDGAFNLPT